MKRAFKWIFVMVIIVACMSAFATTAKADSELLGQGTFGDDNLEWSLTVDGVLTIWGHGETPDYFYRKQPWLKCGQFEPYYDEKGELQEDLSRCPFIKKIVVEEGVTRLGNYLFECLTSVTDIKLPESLRSMGHGVFGWCESLTNINLPAGVQTFGKGRSFKYCKSLETVDIPTEGWLGEFGYCTSLKVIKIPVIDSIYYLSSVKEIYYPGSASSWATVKGSDKYSGVKMHYYYNYTNFDYCTASTAYASYSYTGKEVKPVVTVKTAGGTKLRNGINYSLKYEDNINYGTATIIVTPIGKYHGPEKRLTFNIGISKVKNLEILESSATNVTIGWTPKAEAKEYLIYNGTLHKIIGRTTKSRYTLTGLRSYNRWRIWVYAIVEVTDQNGNTYERRSIGNSVRIHDD